MYSGSTSPQHAADQRTRPASGGSAPGRILAGLVALLSVVGLVVAAGPARPAAAAPPPARGTAAHDTAPHDTAAHDTAPQGTAVPTAASSSFDAIAANRELTSDHATVFRLYWAFFGREPDPGGALYWIGRRDACIGLDTIAEQFALSTEFHNRYGALDDAAFVELAYRNVLARAADPEGLAYWTGLLARGDLRQGGVVLYISLSTEFTARHPYPSDRVPARSCHLPDGGSTGRGVDVTQGRALLSVGGMTLRAPTAVVERAGFHQSSHPGALALDAVSPPPTRMTTMGSRGRGTHGRSAIDIVTDPRATIESPVDGVVVRAGGYRLYCRYHDEYVVIRPDARPDLEVKILHVTGVTVPPGQWVAAGSRIAAHATTFPFRSQVDALTAEPSWPHVHIEVVDPSVPRRPGSC